MSWRGVNQWAEDTKCGLSCTSYFVCEGGNNCCNPHTQQEEDEDEPQQSDVDSDDLVGEESD